MFFKVAHTGVESHLSQMQQSVCVLCMCGTHLHPLKCTLTHLCACVCMFVCVCVCVLSGPLPDRGWLLGADKSVRIFQCSHAETALSASSLVGGAGPARLHINTPLMRPFLEDPEIVEEGGTEGGGGG